MARKADTVSRFELDGEVLEIDIDTLTFGESEFVESYFDKPFGEIPWESAKAMLVIATLAKARAHPDSSLPEVMDSLRGVEVGALKESKAKRPTKTPETSGDQS